MFYDGAFFTRVRANAHVFDDDDAEGKRNRAAYIFDRDVQVVEEVSKGGPVKRQ